MKPLVLILLALTIILGANFYVFFRLWHLVPVGKPLVVAVAVMLVSCVFLGFLGGYFLPVSVVTVAYRVGMAWLIIMMYLLLVFLVVDIVRWVVPMQKIWFGNGYTFVVLAVVMTAIFTYGNVRYRNIVRVELPVVIHKEISPLKIVAISDLHLGYGIGKTELERWVSLINSENPDLVLLAGDIIDNDLRPLIKHDMAAALRHINARHGVYACLGNHEYIGAAQKFSQLFDFFAAANITVLRDTAIILNDEFYLIGRDDYSNLNRKPLSDLLQTLDTTKPLILFDHQPFDLDETEQHRIDLRFAGHTHHGQVVPVSWITNKMYEVSHGYLRKGNSHIYVSSGMGIWGGKFRIGTRSEYVVMGVNSD